MPNDKGSIIEKIKIIRIVQETENAKTFQLEPQNDLSYTPGQYLTLVFKKGQKEDRRSYSFSSSPALNEPMQITVKRVVNGEYSRLMLDHCKEGDTLLSSGIGGFFQLPEKPNEVEGFIFFAAGSGITPVYSMIKTLLHTSTRPVTLLYSNKSTSDTIFYDDLLTLKATYPERFTIDFLFSDIFDYRKSRLSNWILLQFLSAYTKPVLEKSLFYLCGPASYMQMINITLLTAGVYSDHIIKENFSSDKFVSHTIPPDKETHQVELYIKNNTYRFSSQYPDSILATAKKLGIELPYSCEAGRCGSCAATCVKGKVWMSYNEVLTEKEIQKGRILTCQGFAIEGDVVIQY